jgi:hypothetical protein
VRATPVLSSSSLFRSNFRCNRRRKRARSPARPGRMPDSEAELLRPSSVQLQNALRDAASFAGRGIGAVWRRPSADCRLRSDLTSGGAFCRETRRVKDSDSITGDLAASAACHEDPQRPQGVMQQLLRAGCARTPGRSPSACRNRGPSRSRASGSYNNSLPRPRTLQTSRSTSDVRLEPVSVTCRTGLRYAETEIGNWRAETGAAKPPIHDRKSRNCRPETRVCQPNPRECRRFSHTGKSPCRDRCPS